MQPRYSGTLVLGGKELVAGSIFTVDQKTYQSTVIQNMLQKGYIAPLANTTVTSLPIPNIGEDKVLVREYHREYFEDEF